MKRFLIVTAGLLMACHHEKKLDTRLDETKHEVSTENDTADTHEVRQQGPTDIKTDTDREDDNAVVAEEPDGTVIIAKVPRKKPLVLPKGSRITGTLDLGGGVKTTQEKKLGPVTDDKSSEVKTAKAGMVDTSKKLDTHLDDIHDTGPNFKFYLFLLLALGVILAGGYFYLKMVKKVSWL